jgi:DNA-directed RNA polymerase III subunit RPC1
MNITLGVPRIKEIINASKKISSPIITAPLEISNDVTAARIVKGRIEKTLLGEVSSLIEEVYTRSECYLRIQLDMKAIQALQLDIDAYTVMHSIYNTKKLKLKQGIIAKSEETLLLYPNQAQGDGIIFNLQRVKSLLPSVVVRGLEHVNRAVINNTADDSKPSYNLLVEGYNLLRVMGTLGVKGKESYSNHVEEMRSVLGIEAARLTIMKEIHNTMESHGLSIDPRHVSLLADIMTYRGEILGITRFGVAKMKESVLMLASFEKTADHLFEAAIRGTKDKITGVSECIIMGNQIPVGTGLFSLLHAVQPNQQIQTKLFEKKSLLLNSINTKLKI